MTTEIYDPLASASALRRGLPLVEAPRDFHGVMGALGVARARRMDSTGALRLMGLRGATRRLLQQAAEAGLVTQDAVSRSDEIVNTLVRARAKQGVEGRLDSKDLGIKSDRLDSANASASIALARELEYIYNEVLREERPIMSARKLFTVDTSVPAGAKTHTIRRIESSGEAVFWRSGQPIPFVGIGRDEATYPIRHAVIGLEMDFFNTQSDAYAGINEYGEKVRAAMEAMAEFVNIAYWFGSQVTNLFGIVNYPWLLKRLIATVFTSPTSDAIFTAQVGAINNMIAEVMDRNPGVSASLRFITSPGFLRYMGQSRHPTSQRTMKEIVEAGNPNVNFESAPELQGAGPGGEDGALIVPQGSKGPRLVMPVDFTMMPIMVGNHGFTQTQVGYTSLGGVILRDVLRSVLVWFSRP